MYALIVVLNAVELLDDILAGFALENVSGATILDSQGMGSAIVNSDHKNIPLFSTLSMFLSDSHPYSKTIFTVLENDEMVDRAVSVVQEMVGSISSTGAGFMFTIPIGKVYNMSN